MINIIIGTRAQLIKMAPVISLLESNKIYFTLIHTGQHLESLAEICEDFDIETPWQSLYHGKEVSTISQAFFWCWAMFKLLMRILAMVNTDSGHREHVPCPRIGFWLFYL